MHNVYDCASSFLPLLDTEYHLILGRKGIAKSFTISFDKKRLVSFGGTAVFD